MKYEEITSRKNPNIVLAASIAEKKYRDKTGLFCFEGSKLLSEILQSDYELECIMFTGRAFEKYGNLLDKVSQKTSKLYLVSDSVYEKITNEKSPQGIFTIAKQKKIEIFSNISQSKGIIFLDSVQNPSNLGTIARSAFSLGDYAIVCTPDCADIYNPKAIRAAMGAIFKLEFYSSGEIKECFKKIKAGGRRVLATVLSEKAVEIQKANLCPNDCLVIGNEGNGVSGQVLQECDVHVIIPMQEGAESLNAAAACAIFIWEANRQ